eukprot:3015992-Pleurochrysis_carterae.AAC.1
MVLCLLVRTNRSDLPSEFAADQGTRLRCASRLLNRLGYAIYFSPVATAFACQESLCLELDQAAQQWRLGATFATAPPPPPRPPQTAAAAATRRAS